jgi:hypothetical protein
MIILSLLFANLFPWRAIWSHAILVVGLNQGFVEILSLTNDILLLDRFQDKKRKEVLGLGVDSFNML